MAKIFEHDPPGSRCLTDGRFRLLAALFLQAARDVQAANRDFPRAVSGADFLLDVGPDILTTIDIPATPHQVQAWVKSGCKKNSRLLEMELTK